jgi:1,4-dihydroxy-2-naphthoyl-CoA synthase
LEHPLSHITLDIKEQVAHIVINRPQDGNKLDMAMIHELMGHFTALGSSADIKVIHLSGQGRDFSNGRLVPPASPGVAPAHKSALELRSQVTDPILSLYATIRRSPIPIVSSIRGVAHGLGCAVAVLCDLTLASDQARFSLPEMRSNIPPTLAISAVMHTVSPKALAHLIYSSDEISASQALSLGMVSAVYPDAQFDQEVQAYLQTLCTRPREALCAVKEYLLLAPSLDHESAARYASNLLASVMSSAT